MIFSSASIIAEQPSTLIQCLRYSYNLKLSIVTGSWSMILVCLWNATALESSLVNEFLYTLSLSSRHTAMVDVPISHYALE